MLNDKIKIYVDEDGFVPTRAHSTDAGMDLYAKADTLLKAHGSATFDTGVHVELPKGTYGKIESKSGLNIKYCIVCCGGVIDEGYTGSIAVKLYNMGSKDYLFRRGDKIAQLIIQPCLYVDAEQTDCIRTDTERGNNGFGSTGR